MRDNTVRSESVTNANFVKCPLSAEAPRQAVLRRGQGHDCDTRSRNTYGSLGRACPQSSTSRRKRRLTRPPPHLLHPSQAPLAPVRRILVGSLLQETPAPAPPEASKVDECPNCGTPACQTTGSTCLVGAPVRQRWSQDQVT